MNTKTQNNTLARKILKSREISLIIVLAILILILTLVTDTFATKDNIYSFIRQVSVTAVVACGMTIIVSSGGIDLSIGDNISLCGVIMAICFREQLGDVIGIGAALAVGALVGMLNGILITYTKIPAFIVTLGMQNICKGVTLVVTKGYPINLESDVVYAIGQKGIGFLGDVPIMLVFVPVAALVGYFLLNRTVLGNHIKAIGGNETAARLSGLNVRVLRIVTYTIAGAFAAFAAILLTGRMNAGNPNASGTIAMDAIAATIVGGTSMAGGNGSVIGAILGAILMQLIKTGLVLLSVNMYWQTVVIGVVLISVCTLDSLTQKINK